MFAINQNQSVIRHGRIRFPDGKWRQQTSGCIDEKDAAEIFVTMQYFMNQSNKPCNSSSQALLRLMRRVYKEKTGEESPLMLAKDYFEQFVSTNKFFTAGSTSEQMYKTAEWFLKFLSVEGQENCLLEDITPPLIKRFGAYLVTNAGHSVVSANLRLEKLVTIFNSAVQEKLISENPAKNIRLKDRAAESEEDLEIHQPYTKQHVYLSIDRGLAPGCNPELAIVHLLSIDIGSRLGDVFAWERRMLQRNTEVKRIALKYYCRKARKWHRVYPLAETVSLILEYLDYHLIDKCETALFFPTYGHRTGPAVPDKDFNLGSSNAMNYFAKYLDTLKIRSKLPSDLQGRSSYSHSGHSGRVTCITMMAQFGFPESVTRSRVLHHGGEVHRVYQKHSPEAIQRMTNEEFNDQGPANITFAEFKAAVQYATERLRSLRGKLDLNNGSVSQGDRTRRACLLPVSLVQQ